MPDPLREALQQSAALPDSRPCEERLGWSALVMVAEAREIAYQDGATTTALSARYGVSVPAICGILERRGVPRRNASMAQRRHAVDHHAFDRPSPAADYWAGFLFADGTIVRRSGAPEIALVLSSRDDEHVGAFRDFLQSTHAIHRRSTNGAWGAHGCTRFSVRSGGLVEALDRLGYKQRPTGRLRRSADFWRGVVDGDGYVATDRLELVGDAVLLGHFATFVRGLVSTTATVKPHKSIYRVSLGGGTARRVIAALYDRPGPVLGRKHNAALNILNRAWAGSVVEVAHVAA